MKLTIEFIAPTKDDLIDALNIIAESLKASRKDIASGTLFMNQDAFKNGVRVERPPGLRKKCTSDYSYKFSEESV